MNKPLKFNCIFVGGPWDGMRRELSSLNPVPVPIFDRNLPNFETDETDLLTTIDIVQYSRAISFGIYHIYHPTRNEDKLDAMEKLLEKLASGYVGSGD